MGKTRNDEEYDAGFEVGKNGTFLDDFALGNFYSDDEIFKKGYNEGVKHRYDDTSKSDDDGGCYLTTACINSMNLPNSCFELTVLRNFRDKILFPTPHGRESIKEYYKIAPEIVHAVNEKGKDIASRTWNSTYRDIRKAISLILSNDFDGAFEHYKEMTLDLKEKYLR